MINIVIVDHPGSGAPDFKTLIAYAAAMDKGLKGEFAEAYNRAASIRYGDAKDMQATDRVLGLFADADQPGALGYHDPDGFGKAFPLLDAQDGAELSTTIDHEGKELVEDLLCIGILQGSDGRIYADEPCDAVEMGKYLVDGVWLSNFVLGSWYTGKGSKFDYLGTLKAPQTVDAGGYAQWLGSGGWNQMEHAELLRRSYRRLSWRTARRTALLRAA